MATVIDYVELTLRFNREGSKWVGVCLELGTSTYAKTLERVQKDLCELVTEHLSLLEEAGERARFFTEHGIISHPVRPKPHEIRIPNVGTDVLYGDTSPFFQPRIFEVAQPLVAA